MRSSTSIFFSCSSTVPGMKSATVTMSLMRRPLGSRASLSRIACFTSGTCSGVSASIIAPAMFVLPPKTLSAFVDHAPAPDVCAWREPIAEKSYSHGSWRYVRSGPAAQADATAATAMTTTGAFSVIVAITPMIGPRDAVVLASGRSRSHDRDARLDSTRR